MGSRIPSLEHALRDLAFDEDAQARALERAARQHPQSAEALQKHAAHARRLAAVARDLAAGIRF